MADDYESLESFAARVLPLVFPALSPLPPHFTRILRVFQLAEDGALRLKINIPPRHGKTVCALITIAWMMVVFPRMRNAYATYGQTFSELQGKTLISFLTAAGVRMAVQRADYIETASGSCCYITSRGGVLLGKGIDGLIVIDDPYKDPEEAHSAVVQQAVIDWWYGAMRTRLEGPASVVLMHQRWNIFDMSQVLDDSSSETWHTLRIPAISESGEALWPRVKSLADLLIEQRDNEYVFASMYQQEPIPRGSEVFKAATRYDLQEWLATLDAHRYRWAIGVDPATTAEASADFSALVLMATEGEGDTMVSRLVDCEHAQVETPELITLAKAMREKWVRKVPSLPLIVEGVGGFIGVAQSLRRAGLHDDQVRMAKVRGDKKTRSAGYASAWNQGRVLVPSNVQWADPLVLEHRRFTGAERGKDDRVDAGTHAWNYQWRGAPELKRGLQPLRIHTMG